MYCLKPFLINNDLLFSFVSNKNGVAVKPSRGIIKIEISQLSKMKQMNQNES